MKSMVSGLTATAALLAASVVATPSAAMPTAELSSASVETSLIKVNGGHIRHHRHYHYYYRPLLYVGRGVWYGCRSGWYCFGPPIRPNFTRAWYGGFNSIYGYQGARWRPPRRDTEATSTPSSVAPPPRSDLPPSSDTEPPPTGTK